MPTPSPLAIATQAVQRLVKEETYYQKELAQQSAKVAKLEAELKQAGSETSQDGNAEFILKQEQKAIQETSAVFPSLRTRISDAVARLEEQIATAESEDSNATELEKAREALRLGKSVESNAEEKALAA
ncbi:putative tubulin-specific chaperone Rbl2 [Xylariaceae sp. FL0016]|nr:putative tubulin-specific chaperone Rbl2 [Xylariaceae sp. FL0016]